MRDEFDDGLTREHLPAWHEGLIADLDFPLGWRPGMDPEAWRRTAKETFLSALIEDPAPVDPAPRMMAVEQRAGYRVEHISLALGRHRRSQALLAIPDGKGPFPAALLLHDHGAFFSIGKEKMIKPLAGDPKSAIAADWMARNYEGHSLGDDLAQRGWVVLAGDALGWGSRDCGGYENQQAIASNLFNLGSSWAGLIAVEDLAAAAFLAGLPEVDPARLVSIGHSMGGFRSYQALALSDHIRAGVALCCFGNLATLMQPGANRTRGQSAFAMTHPGLSRRLDFPDLAAIAAPKPLLMVHGQADSLFPESGVQAAAGKTAAVYRAFGAGDRFHSVLRPGGHVFSASDQALAWSWLDREIRSELSKGPPPNSRSSPL